MSTILLVLDQFFDMLIPDWMIPRHGDHGPTVAAVTIILGLCLIAWFISYAQFLFKAELFSGTRSLRKLVILDMNNVLVCRAFKPKMHEQDPKAMTLVNSSTLLGEHYTWERPHMREFVTYCLDNFDVAVWSGAMRENVDLLCSHVFGDRRKELAFEWDQSKCDVITPGQGSSRPALKKPIARVQDVFPGRWKQEDIIMIDDSAAKMSLNPPGSFILASAWVPWTEDGSVHLGLHPDAPLRGDLKKFFRQNK